METTSHLMAQAGFLLTPSSQKHTVKVTSTLIMMSHGPLETTWVSGKQSAAFLLQLWEN